MESAREFFDFAAEVGLTKHLGGLEATESSVDLCHIGPGKVVLDVGCGAGATPVALARRHGCRVVGVDINPRMIRRCQDVALRAGVSEQMEFRASDAQDLPFPDARIDAIITESVTAFPEDKQAAVDEYARVTRPGGYVGLNESTWLKTPPPPQVLAWAAQEVGAHASPLTADAWTALLTTAALAELVVEAHAIDVRDEGRGVVRRYGTMGILRTLWRTLRLYLRNPAYRAFVKRIRVTGIAPPNLAEYFGYGLYVGRMPVS